MRVSYDAQVDVLSIFLSDRAVFESDEDEPGIILDYDGAENLIGVEILDASGVKVNVTGYKDER